MKLYLSITAFLVLSPQLLFAGTFSEKFASPDQSCHLLYESAQSHGEGVFYDITRGDKRVIHKGYLRVGPIVNWVSNSVAELKISEGSPGYHSYFYDCRDHRTSPSYSLPIAFEPKFRIIATLEQEEVIFYRLFSNQAFHRATAPGVGLMEYFGSCEADSWFENAKTFRITMKCEDGDAIDLTIKVPN